MHPQAPAETDLCLDILVISDLHYVRKADHVCALPQRNTSLGPVLLEEALLHLQQRAVQVGLIVLLGDVVDNGLAQGAEEDLEDVAAAARRSGLPTLAVPGNHDGDFERFAQVFGCGPGLRTCGGCGFLLFHDHVAPDDVTTRPAHGLSLPRRAASEHPGSLWVALQHNPLHPRIDARYPYMLSNAGDVLATYGRAGVILSLSGHYHPGQRAHPVGGTTYYTIPAACEAPFAFAHVHLEDRQVEIRQHTLPHLAPGHN